MKCDTFFVVHTDMLRDLWEIYSEDIARTFQGREEKIKLNYFLSNFLRFLAIHKSLLYILQLLAIISFHP